MAYNEQKHVIFVNRCKNLANALQNIRDESARLDAIYVNETASGENVAFVDTPVATKTELINAILLMRDIKSFFENEAVSTVNRTVWLTPFTSNEQ